MESVDRSGRRLRQLLIMGALVAALYVWAFGLKKPRRRPGFCFD